MPIATVFAVYLSAAVAALVLLHFFRAIHWYWHVISALLALTIGLVPIPVEWQAPAIDLFIGGSFTFLFIWGVCAPLFPGDHGHHDRRHAPPHHA